jgi:hypothetical protein
MVYRCRASSLDCCLTEWRTRSAGDNKDESTNIPGVVDTGIRDLSRRNLELERKYPLPLNKFSYLKRNRTSVVDLVSFNPDPDPDFRLESDLEKFSGKKLNML